MTADLCINFRVCFVFIAQISDPPAKFVLRAIFPRQPNFKFGIFIFRIGIVKFCPASEIIFLAFLNSAEALFKIAARKKKLRN